MVPAPTPAAPAAGRPGFPVRRLRRLRRTPALRRLVAETRLGVDDLIAPLFVRDGIDAPAPIASMPGQSQHTVDSLVLEATRLVSLGLPGLILFGVPSSKDATGSEAWNPQGIAQRALRAVRQAVGDELVLMADLCLDEYTDHGHCGVLGPDGEVLNDATLELYQRVALAQAEAGADVVAPSGMMDGQVAAIRAALDGSGHDQVAILAYASKYASALYGPFRDAVDVQIAGGGDRRAYQQDPRNRREALDEIAQDLAEGADMIMVKPAMTSLDVLGAARRRVPVPLAAYHVSGEYAMVQAAAAAGWIDGPAVALEQLTALKRAGADFILTYFAAEVADASVADRSNADWFARATRVIPGGVDSPVRSFASVGGTPYTVASGDGPYVVDVEGTRYIDLVQSYGAVLLGHAHPAVTEAVTRAAALGTTFGAPTPGEVLLAEAICARVPGCEQVRLVSSGTEAAMSAVRLARGITGRDGVVKFDGCYHGHSDGLLAGGGSGVAMLGLPGSAGVPAGAVAATAVLPYNVAPELGDDVACVIVEAVAANMNLVAPGPGFLAGLRAACDAAGALLIFDEVITGFRVGAGGATAWSGVTPDLWCFGKVIGGGLPVGALGGRRELLASLAPGGPVYQAGTLSGNPLATAAGLAVLSQVTDGDYVDLGRRAAAFAAGLESAIAQGGLAVRAPVVGPLVGLFLAPPGPGGDLEAPVDYVTARALAGNGVYPRFFHAMLRRGVALAPGAYEVMFPGLAHTEAVLARVVAAAGEAATEVARELAAT